MIKANKEIKNINISTLIVHTKKDELVSNKSLDIFNKRLNNNYKIINLQHSGHFYYDECELREILKEFELFLYSAMS